MAQEKTQQFDLSLKSIFLLYLPFLLIIAFYYFRRLILIGLLSVIIASLLDRPINALEKKIKNRLLSVILVYLLLLGLLGLLILLVSPSLKNIFYDFVNLPLAKDFFQHFDMKVLLENNSFSLSQNQSIRNIFNQAFQFLSNVIGGMSLVLLSLLLSFFLNLKRDTIKRGISLFSPKKYKDYFVRLWENVNEKVFGWFTSQIFISLFVGLLIYATFKILNLEYAELMAILAGILDFLPYIGPLIAGFLACVVAFQQNLFLGITVLGVVILIQGIEAIFAPFIRSRAMKINPLVLLISIMIGEHIAGFLGIVIAIPLSVCLFDFLKDLESGKITLFSEDNRKDEISLDSEN